MSKNELFENDIYKYSKKQVNCKIRFYCGFGERASSGLSFIYKAWSDGNWIEPELEQDYIPNRTTLKLKMIEKVDNKVDNKNVKLTKNKNLYQKE